MYKRNPLKSVTVSASRSMQAAYPTTLNFYQPTTVDEFTQVKDDADGSICITSAATMLLNQNRLDRLSNEAIIQAISKSAQSSDALATLRSKCTDEQLISLVKSRYIQSPSELLAWSNHIENLFPSVKQPAASEPEPAPAHAPAPDPVQ